MEQYLSRIRKIDTLIANKKNECKRLKEIAYGLGGYSEGERVMSSKTYDKSTNAICRYVDIENEIDELEIERETILKNIEKLPSNEYDLLYRLYVDNRSFKDLSIHFDKSYSWVKKTKKRALNHLQDIMKKE